MISQRLKIITKYIEPTDRIVDVGCDHGLLSIYLYQNNLCELIIASDKNHNALKNAVTNIKKENLSKQIQTFISDGVSDIDLGKFKINTLVIAGMGSNTILNILKDKKTTRINKLIIQSNNDHYLLRKAITKAGFYIKDETIIKENNKYYVTICFLKGTSKYKEREYLWGLYKKENVEYYQHLLDNYQKIIAKIPRKKVFLRYKANININRLQKLINKSI